MMDRRRFLTTSAAVTTALGAGTALDGCATSGLRLGELLSHINPAELVARLQHGIGTLRGYPFGTIVRGRPEDRPDLTEHVFRQSLESLLVLDVLRSLPEGAPVPSALAAAIAPLLPAVEQCTHTHHALLRAMPEGQRRGLDAQIRARPELVMNIAEWLDEKAADIGVPNDNRMRLRSAAVSAGARIRRQSTGAVVDDCVTRLDAMIARFDAHPPAALVSSTRSVVGEMWRVAEARVESAAAKQKDQATRSPRAPRAPGAPDSRLVVPDRFGASREMENPTEPVQWSPYWGSPGDQNVRTGAIMMPFGLVTCGVLLIVGVIVLAVGASQNGNWDGRTQQQP